MAHSDKKLDVSAARLNKREAILAAANALLDSETVTDFDPIHFQLCPVDVVLIAGAPWLMDGLEKDFFKDESGYRKIGGGANTPSAPYFFRSTHNLIHFLKRQNLYYPRGSVPAAPGMACFFDWDDRGRFNFAPDRNGIVTRTEHGQIREVVLAVRSAEPSESSSYRVTRVQIDPEDSYDRALIGYSDLP